MEPIESDVLEHVIGGIVPAYYGQPLHSGVGGSSSGSASPAATTSSAGTSSSSGGGGSAASSGGGGSGGSSGSSGGGGGGGLGSPLGPLAPLTSMGVMTTLGVPIIVNFYGDIYITQNNINEGGSNNRQNNYVILF